jgi:hypothetical protein
MQQRPSAAKQAAEKGIAGLQPCPQRLKPDSKQCTYRSGKPLRHPKSSTTPTFSASCKAVDEEKLAIAALKRCATQNQVQR